MADESKEDAAIHAKVADKAKEQQASGVSLQDAMKGIDFEDFMKDAKGWTEADKIAYAQEIEPGIFAESTDELALSDDAAAMNALAVEGLDDNEVTLHWKERGNEAMTLARTKKNKVFYRNAAGYYGKAIEAAVLAARAGHVDAELHATCLSNRAAANLYLKNYGSVRRDCVAALGKHPTNVKAYYRAAKASNALGKWEEGAGFARMGLKLDPENAELAKLLGAANKKVAEAHEKAKAAKRAKQAVDFGVAQLKRACTKRNIAVGPAQFMAGAQTYKSAAVIGKDGGMAWPVVLLYDEYDQSDFVQSWSEGTMLAQQLAMMFPLEDDGSPPPPWDERADYRADRLEVWVQEGVVEPFASVGEWRAYFCRGEGVQMGDGNDAEEVLAAAAKRAATYDPSKHPWVQLPIAANLLQTLQTPGYVVPSVPTLHVMVTGSAFAKSWREGKIIKEMEVREGYVVERSS